MMSALLGLLSLSVIPLGLHYFPMFFFFNDTATTEIYTLSLHDALPISLLVRRRHAAAVGHRRNGQLRSRATGCQYGSDDRTEADRKSTRLNSSHLVISYAVFCLKKKKIRSIPPSPHHPLFLAPPLVRSY